MVLFLHRTVRLIILRVADLGAITSIEAKSFIPPLRRSMVSPCRWSRGEGGLVPEPGITGVAWSARTDVSDRPERRRL